MLSSISGRHFAGHLPRSIVPSGGTPALDNLIVYYNTADPASFSTSSTTVTNLTNIPNNGTRTLTNFDTTRPASITNDIITLTSDTAYISNDVQTTFSFWLKVTSFPVSSELVRIEYDASNYLKVEIRDNRYIWVTVLNPSGSQVFISNQYIGYSEWTMVTVSYSTTANTIAYIALNDTVTSVYRVPTTDIISKTQTTKITANDSATTQISRYMLWNVALTNAQIKYMYDAQKRYFDLSVVGPDSTIPSPVNMLVYYDMANTASYSTSTPTTVTSLTYYENTASMVGAYTYNDTAPKSMKSISTDHSNKLLLENSPTAVVLKQRPTTIAFWIKTETAQTESVSDIIRISVPSNSAYLNIARGNSSFGRVLFINYRASDGSSTSSSNMSPVVMYENSIWQFVTVVIIPNVSAGTQVVKAYIDGNLITTNPTGPLYDASVVPQNISIGMSSTTNASWSKYMMWEGELTATQISELFAAQKRYYIAGFTGVLDYTGLGVLGIFASTNSPANNYTNYGLNSFFGGNSVGLTVTPGIVDQAPPYMTITTGGSFTSTSLGGTYAMAGEHMHYNVWINPIGTLPGGQLMRFAFGTEVIITLSMNTSRQLSATVVKAGFTRNLSSTTIIPTNKWSMVSISVVISDSLACYLSIDGTAQSGGGATGALTNGNPLAGPNMTATMMNSTNLRFNQIMVIRDEYSTVRQLYDATKSTYGRL